MNQRAPHFVALSKVSTLLLAASLFLGTTVKAADGGAVPVDAPTAASDAKKKQDQAQAEAMRALIETLLNNIDQAQIDFETEGVAENGKDVVNSLLNVSGNLHFKEDIKQALVASTGSPDQPADKTLEGLVPQLTLGLKGLYVDAKYSMRGDSATAVLQFYSGYDAGSKSWKAQPLVANISNKLNRSLLMIRLHSLQFTLAKDPKNSDSSLVNGTCKSDKQAFNLTTGKVMIKPVQCEFSGYVGKDGKYKIKYKYVNQ